MPGEEDKPRIDAGLVRQLVARQFPQWADLPVEPLIPGGWDNQTFRLGSEMTVRLPSAERYVAQVEKEQRWLPILAPELPLPIPEPIALGDPGEGYPWPWSIYRWIEGEPAESGMIADREEFADRLGAFLVALRRAGTIGAPVAGKHNFFRGGDLGIYAGETEAALAALGTGVNQAACRAIWEEALSSRWEQAPVWVHGDVSAGNVLVRDGRLAAIIDFGSSAIGDPACDLYIAWTFLDGASRAVFRNSVGLDKASWARLDAVEGADRAGRAQGRCERRMGPSGDRGDHCRLPTRTCRCEAPFLIQIKARPPPWCDGSPMWNSVSSAPYGRDIELAVIDRDGEHVLVFACRRAAEGWVKAETGERLEVHPTHWREWEERTIQNSARG